MRKIYRAVILILTIIFIFPGCGEDIGSKSIGSISFKAKLGADITGKYDYTNLKVVAVPFAGMHPLDEYNGKNFTKTGTVNSDGSFSIKLDKEVKPAEGTTFPGGSTSQTVDYVLFVCDSSSGSEKIISFISLPGSDIAVKGPGAGGLNSIDTIIKFPVADADGDIYAGTLVLNTEYSESQSGESAEGFFSLSSDRLDIMAKSDDTVKSLKNSYENRKYETKVFYYWNDPSNKLPSTTDGVFETHPDNLRFEGCSISFWDEVGYSGSLGTYDNIKNGNTVLSLYPPADVYSNSGETDPYGTLTPITSTGTYDSSIEIEDDGRLQCIFGENLTSIPKGSWLLKSTDTTELPADEKTIGTFDFEIGNPFIDSSSQTDSKLKIYVPAIKVTVADGLITSIEIKFYFIDDNREYVPVTDYSALPLEDIDWDIYISYSSSGDDVNVQDMDCYKTDKFVYSAADLKGIDLTFGNIGEIAVNLNPGPYSYDFRWSKE